MRLENGLLGKWSSKVQEIVLPIGIFGEQQKVIGNENLCQSTPTSGCDTHPLYYYKSKATALNQFPFSE